MGESARGVCKGDIGGREREEGEGEGSSRETVLVREVWDVTEWEDFRWLWPRVGKGWKPVAWSSTGRDVSVIR